MIVKLRVGAGPLRLEEVETTFTDTDCVVWLPGSSILPELSSIFLSFAIPHPSSLLPTLSLGGRQWGGVFYAEIESSCTKIQTRKGGFLQLALRKKVPLLTWPSLLVSSRAGCGRDTQCS